ncbi:hypothetical protein BDV18DRAFT_159343 [Aspergillus unguis]
MPSIKNTNVLVIGGSSGIGLGVAEKCLAEDATVHIASSNPARINEAIASLQAKYPSSKPTGHVCDLNSEEVEKNLQALLEAVQPLDHIVFTAGDRLNILPLENISLDSIRQAGHVRFVVPLLLAKLAPKYMTRGSGSKASITLTSGSSSEKPIPGWSLFNGYCTGLQGTTRSLAVDLKPLRVNLVIPGAVRTPLLEGLGAEVLDAMAQQTALGKIGSAEEVAEAYVYLMKDSNATGSCVSTNAGGPLI